MKIINDDKDNEIVRILLLYANTAPGCYQKGRVLMFGDICRYVVYYDEKRRNTNPTQVKIPASSQHFIAAEALKTQ